MTTHYHVVSVTDFAHRSGGFPNFDLANDQAAALDGEDLHGVVVCFDPNCEMVRLADNGRPEAEDEQPATATDDPPPQTCRRCGGPWTPKAASLWLCDDCYFPKP